MTAEDLAAVLQRLRTSTSEHRLGEYVTFELQSALPDGRVLLAVNAELEAQLLLPLPAGAAVIEDRTSASVQLRGRVLADGKQHRLFGVLNCRTSASEGTWRLLVAELLKSLAADTRRADAVAKETVERWRSLFDRPPKPALGRHQLAGVFGELMTLAELLKLGQRITCWTGALRQRHDFRIASDAIEVKATLSNDRDVVTVHGISQMEAPSAGRLFLLRYRLEVADSGHSIPKLADELVAAGVDAANLYELLDGIGYDVRHSDEFKAIRFSIREVTAWRVVDGFPRLTPAAFAGSSPPVGVTSIDYQIDLSVANRFKLAQHEWDSLKAGWDTRNAP
jgi:Putative  PD-(D/E)XK family member, (DUF4420)